MDKYLDGELRELVELRVPPQVLALLIRDGKAKERNGMIYFPHAKIGAVDTFTKHESGDQPDKALTDGDAQEIEDGIDNMRELVTEDPMKALDELGTRDYEALPSSGTGQLAICSGQLAITEVLRVRNLGPASVPHRFHISVLTSIVVAAE